MYHVGGDVSYKKNREGGECSLNPVHTYSKSQDISGSCTSTGYSQDPVCPGVYLRILYIPGYS
jgi:hypothetical protein